MPAPPPSTSRKNKQGLPPTYLLHLRSLLHQFLSQQLAPPDEGLPGPSNRAHVPDRPLWSPERLAEIEQSVWGVVLKDGGGDKDGLLGCDWDQWTTGARLRKQAWKREKPVLGDAASAVGNPGAEEAEGTLRGLALRLPVAGLLPSALSSATSTPVKGPRSPSPASSSRSQRSLGPDRDVAQGLSQTPDRKFIEPIDEVQEWCCLIRELKGFLPLNESQKEGWEVLDDNTPLRTPIREVPGAFPQAYSAHSSSAYFAQSVVSLSSSPRRPEPTEPLPPMLKPVICVSFISAPPAYTSGSARSQSTLRFSREGSQSEAGSSRHRGSVSVTASGIASGAGSGGLGGLGGWLGNKWSEMTASADDGKVEMEFVPGRFALPVRPTGVRRRASAIKRRLRESTMDNGNNDSNDGDDNQTDNDDTVDSHGSAWSGTERGDDEGRKDTSENVLIAGSGLDIPRAAAQRGEVGVVGGTIVIRGAKREEERRALERVFKAIIYTIQSNTYELSLLDAFSVPRELDPVDPPRPPPKPESKRTRTTVDVPRPSSPSLSRANSHGSGGRKGFFAKLGLGPSENGKGVGRGMWNGLMGKRRASQIVQSPDEDGDAGEVRNGLHRQSSLSRDRSASIPEGQNNLPHHTPPMAHTQPHLMGGIDRHLHLLAHLGGMLHSTTPGLAFPLPAILLRVQEEDRVRREKAGEELKVENITQGSGATTPQPIWATPASGPRPRAGTITLGAGSARSNATRGTVGSTGTGIDGLPLGQPLAIAPRTDDIRGRAVGYRLGGDVRSGLASLAGNLEGWEGWWRLQRIEYLFWIGVEEAQEDKERKVVACTKPEGSVHRYYDPGSDVSVEEYLGELADELGIAEAGAEGRSAESSPDIGGLEKETSGEKDEHEEGDHAFDESGSWEPVCARPRCGVAERDHLRIWASGGRRIVGKVIKTQTGGESAERLGTRAQVECDVCGAQSGWTSMSIVQGMSWNKLLELMMYSSILVSPTLCPHSSPPARSSLGVLNGFTYVLTTPTLTLRLTSEAQSVLDTRLPKLQVGPLVAKRKVGVEAAKAASEAFASHGGKGDGIGKERDMDVLIKGWRDEVGKWVDGLAESSEAQMESLRPVKAGLEGVAVTLLKSIDNAEIDQATSYTQAQSDIARIQVEVESWRAEQKADMPFPDVVIPSLPKSVGESSKGVKLPGSEVLFRDDEPASVIAYTLSSLAYFNELCGGTGKTSTTPATTDPDAAQPAKPNDQWKIEVSRRDNPREILPLRALAKKRSELSLPSTGRLPLTMTPNAPSLELNLQPVSGHSGTRDGGGIDDLVKSISRAAGQDPVLTTSINPMLTPSVMLPRPASAEPSPSVLAVPTSVSGLSLSESDLSVDAEKRTPRFKKRLADEAPPSSYRRTVSASVSADSSPRSTPVLGSETPPRSSRDKENHTLHPSPGLAAGSSLAMHARTASVDKEGWGGSVTSSFASSFNTLLKLGTDVTDSLASRVRSGPGDPSRSLASMMNPLHHTAAADANPDDSRPHIHLELSHPSYKIGCTVYFASAFDTLRRRCAFDRSFVRSLERSVGWAAEGGKSKANFWKTEDGRLVVKSLVTKWNVSDLQALIDIAPAYFEHMATTHNKATALAKIVGFYNVKIHDLNTNEKRSMDLLVMENLFWKQEIDRTFDLKGIEARRVPKGKDNGSTMFDAEWLEGQATSPLFVHPHAKRILLDSLTTDTRFLSNQHIVDYSLLLGLDRAHSELVVGLVDAVGSYGLFKNIESMGKIALNRGREGEVTIVNSTCLSIGGGADSQIPPDQYRERFETALRSYFVACPDKWSRSARRAGTCQEIPLCL